MKKSFKLVVSFALVLAVLVLFGCSKKEAITKPVPYGSIGDNVYLNAKANDKNYTVTEKELYDELKLSRSNSGYNSINYLNEEIAKIVLKDEIAKVKAVYNDNTEGKTILGLKENKTEQEYLKDLFKDQINSQIYGTTEEEKIENLSSRQKQVYEQKFIDSLASQGINLDLSNNTLFEALEKSTVFDNFIISRAKANYALTKLSEEIKDEDNSNYFDESKDFIKYYDKLVKKTDSTKMILIKFESYDKYLWFNEYVDDDDMKTLDRVVNYYNVIYGRYRDKIIFNELPTIEETLEDLILNNKQLTYENTDNINHALMTFINEKLSVEDKLYYNTQPLSYDSNYYIVFKLEDNKTLDYSEQKQEYSDLDKLIMQEYLDSKLTTEYISDAYNDLLKDTSIEIYDPYLESAFKAINKFAKTSNKKSTTSVAKINDTEISVESFFNRLKNAFGPSSAFDIITNKIVLESKYINDITSKEKEQFKTDLNTVIENYKSGKYQNYGINSKLSEKDFYKMYFNETTKNDVLKNYYESKKAMELFLKDYEAINNIYEKFENATKDLYNANFSLDCFHFLIYVDYEDNNTPYNPEKFLETLSTEKQEEFKDAVVNLMKKVYTMLTTNNNLEVESTYDATLDYIIKKYNESNFGSYDDFSYFHQFGLKIKKEDLGEIDNEKALNYDEAFAERIAELANMDIDLSSEKVAKYGAYVDSQKGNVSEYDELLTSSFGYHLIFVTEKKDKSSAKYTESLDTKNTYKEIKYKDREGTLNAYSENDYPSANQIEIYLREKDYKTGIENLPASKTDANGNKINVKGTLETYFTKVFDKFNSDANSLFRVSTLVDSYTFTNKADKDAFVNSLEIAKRAFTSYSYFNVDYLSNPYENWFTTFFN